MDTLVTTDRLIADADRDIHNIRAGLGTVYRTALLATRNKLRSRTKELEDRLAKGDAQYPHDAEPMPPRWEAEWLRLESEYRDAHNAQQRASKWLTEV